MRLRVPRLPLPLLRLLLRVLVGRLLPRPAGLLLMGAVPLTGAAALVGAMPLMGPMAFTGAAALM